MNVTLCNDNPQTWLVEDDAGLAVGMIEQVSLGVFEAAVGTMGEARRIGLAGDLDAAAVEIILVHQAQRRVALAILRGIQRGTIQR